MKRSVVFLFVLLVSATQWPCAQERAWLTDEEARDVAGAAVHSVDPRPCYSTYRNEHLESFLRDVRSEPLISGKIDNSVYIYRVASDVCEYVAEENGKPTVHVIASMDCCEYGIVAVDRATSKSYWFSGADKAAVFREFARDEKLRPDSPEPTLFTGLYLDLAWGESRGNEIRDLQQLRDLVQQNFESAYADSEDDNTWRHKFDIWWQRFRSRKPKLTLETVYEPTNAGTVVRGYALHGFVLSIPRIGPPKGTPQVFQWVLLVRPDGTVEEKGSKLIYSDK